MAYATVSLVKELGGLNEEQDYNLFRYSSPDQLDAAITRKIAVASAWLKTQNASNYATTDADEQVVIGEGEAYLALHFLTMPLKSRKVFGTHWALDQEDSTRFAELIDVEYKAMAEDLLGEFFTVTEQQGGFARPVLIVGPVIDPLTDLTIESEDVQLQEIADEARAWPTVPVVTTG